jgi:hypothetical protein
MGEKRGSHLLTQQGFPQLRDLLAHLSLEAEKSLFELFLSQSLLLLLREEEARGRLSKGAFTRGSPGRIGKR